MRQIWDVVCKDRSIHNFLGGALIGSASGAISGLFGRIVLCRSETGDEAMQGIIDRVVNSLFTVGFSMSVHCICMGFGGLGRNVSLHP